SPLDSPEAKKWHPGLLYSLYYLGDENEHSVTRCHGKQKAAPALRMQVQIPGEYRMSKMRLSHRSSPLTADTFLSSGVPPIEAQGHENSIGNQDGCIRWQSSTSQHN